MREKRMMRNWLGALGRVAVVLAAVLGLSACQFQAKKTSDQDLDLVDYDRLAQFLRDSDTRTVLIDPRPADRFAQGHIPGAINIPLPQIQAADPRLIEAQRIVVYGSDWRDMISPAAAKKLIALGYQNVFDYRGGLEMWRLEGGRIEVSQDAASPQTTQPSS
ncbi:MAG TPA: rhodanese-like domain-containing protein [Phycisphaeraceae bacterium]